MDAERIPKDIDRIATDLVRTPYEDDVEWNMYLAIARAILAERERCAKIAEPINLQDTGTTDYEKQAYDLRDIIAIAIRTPSPATSE